MIEIKNLNKKFGDKIIFENFNLNIEEGEFILFSGVSGAGKTTLLNMIGCLEPIDSGDIIVNDINITNKKNQINYFRNVVGFLFQNFALVDNKTVSQNLMMVKDIDKNQISEALKQVNLEGYEERKVYTLSGGEQQRVALARLMLKKCNLILADEPTGSLDKENAKNIMDILFKLNEYGKTIIMVSHDEEIKKSINKVVNI